MRRLHIIRAAMDDLAMDVVAHQVSTGDEVRVVLTGEAAGATASIPGAEAIVMPVLEYDQLVEMISWSERVVSW